MGRLAVGLCFLALPSLASAQSAEEMVAYIVGGIEATANNKQTYIVGGIEMTANNKQIRSSPAEYEMTVQAPDVHYVNHTTISAIDACHYRFAQTSDAMAKGKRILIVSSRDYDFSGASPASKIDEVNVADASKKLEKRIVIPGLKATNCSLRMQQPETPPSPADRLMEILLMRRAQSECDAISQDGVAVNSYSIERAAQSFAEFRKNVCKVAEH